ncbi:MAG: DUF952 domain-containing protein [Alphaproteobacteria bacterium]|nr:DUF952 domain-containing protein [Alphaproteobacteria bacterium]
MERVIFKVCDQKEWSAAKQAGRYGGAPVDLADGYIHFSTAGQLAETLAKYFAGKENLVLVAVNTENLGPQLRWEPSRGGALFPHLYEDLSMSHVVWERSLPLDDGCHVLPDLVCE